MTVLYRTPNIVIDRYEWHGAVKKRDGRIVLQYYFRPLSLRAYRWLPITAWQGPKPKDFCNRMWKFRLHIALAMRSEELRSYAIGSLRGPVTQAAARNVGKLEHIEAAA